MGSNDDPTVEYLAGVLGKSTRGKGGKHQTEEREVMDADQIKRFLEPSRGNMIVTRFGRRALRVKAAPYYRELPVAFYDADPGHREEPARASSRQTLLTYGGMPGLYQIAHEARKALIPPEPATVSRSDALAMFGLSAGYTHDELNQRRRQMHDAAGTEQMVETVELAYLKLSEREEV
jgi:hypothetical protein